MVLLLELFLLGSGRLLAIGSLTARMIIFTIAVSLSVVIVLYAQKIERKTGLLLLFFLYIRMKTDITLIANLIKSSFFMLIILYIILVSMCFGVLDFSHVYRFISLHSDDIMFRGVSNDNASFCYKGFLFPLFVTFLFFYALDLKNKKSFFLMVSVVFASFIVEFFDNCAESNSIRFIQILSSIFEMSSRNFE